MIPKMQLLAMCQDHVKRITVDINYPNETHQSPDISISVVADPYDKVLPTSLNMFIFIVDECICIFQCVWKPIWSSTIRLMGGSLSLPHSSTNTITRVIKIIESCSKYNKEIDVSHEFREMIHINLIFVLSLEAQLIPNYMEAGLSFERVCEDINSDRKDENK